MGDLAFYGETWEPIRNHGFMLSLTSSHIQKFNFNLFFVYSSLKNPAFLLALRILDHNSRTRFFPNMLFLS